MSNKILISKPTINPLTTTDPDDFIFHSDYDTLKYAAQGTVTLQIDQANYYAFFPGDGFFFPDTWSHYAVGELVHGLGYVPYFAGYILDIPTGGAIQAPFGAGDFAFFAYLSVYADATKLYFVSHFNSTSNSGIVEDTYGYRIFKNDLEL